MAPDGRPPPLRGAREVAEERGPDPREIRRSTGHRDEGDPHPLVEPVKVDDVEPGDDDTVQEDRPHPFRRKYLGEERADPFGGVPAVDGRDARARRFQLLGERDDDRRDDAAPVAPRERAVVDRRDPRVRLGEGATQR